MSYTRQQCRRTRRHVPCLRQGTCMLTIKFDNMRLKFERQYCTQYYACVCSTHTTYNELYHHATNVH